MTRTIIHGTTTAYKTDGCRCEDCRRAARLSLNLWRLRNRTQGHSHRPARRDKVPTDRLRDHIAALIASGYTYRAIDDEAPLPRGYASKIMRGAVATVTRPTMARVLALEPLPDADTVVDEVAVERVLAGAAPLDTLNRAERSAARVEAARRGWTASEITRRLATNGSRAKALVEEAAS